MEYEEVGRLTITSSDTFVAVLCAFHNASLQNEEFWFHTGTGKKGRLSQFTKLHKSCQKKFARFYQLSTHLQVVTPTVISLDVARKQHLPL